MEKYDHNQGLGVSKATLMPLETAPTSALDATIEANRALLNGLLGGHPTIRRGPLPAGVACVEYGAYVLSPIEAMAESKGMFFDTDAYHSANFMEPGATEDGLMIFPNGNAHDRKIGKNYSRNEMGKVARNLGFVDFFVADRSQIRRNPVPESLSSSPASSAPPFNWDRAKIWDYVDENGHLLFQVGRIDTPSDNGQATKKDIRQRRPDGRGFWLYNVTSLRRVLYSLPAVLHAKTVFVVEGEKAADALNKRLKEAELFGQMVATTTSGGASNVGLTEFQEHLKAKTVIVLPDNDRPGKRYAHTICKACVSTSLVKRIELPELPDKGDVVDYFAAGGTLEELLQMVDDAPQLEYADVENESENTPQDTATLDDVARSGNEKVEARVSAPTSSSPAEAVFSAQANTASSGDSPPGGRKRRFRFLSIGELFNFPDPEWLIKGFLVTKTLSLITGPHSSFKSFVALDMALCVATGRDWHGRKTQEGAVVYVAAEGADGLQKRIGAWLFHHDIEEYPANFYAYPRAIGFADPETVKELIADLEADGIRPALIVVDTLARCTSGLDENSARDMGSFIDGLNRISKRLGSHMMVVHHNNKSGGYRGSSSLPAAVDTHFAITRKDDELSLSTEKQKDAAQEAPLAFETHSVLFPHPKHPCEKLSSIVLKLTEATSNVAGYSLSRLAQKALIVLVDEFDNEGTTATEWERACKGLAGANHRRNRRELVERGAVNMKGKRGTVISRDEFKALSSEEQKKVVYYPAQDSNWLKDVLRRRDEGENGEEQDAPDTPVNGEDEADDLDP